MGDYAPRMPTKVSKKLTDEERNALAQKLDDDLDRFIEDMASKQSSTPKKVMDFDQLSREILEHPMFAKDLKVGENGEYSNEIQALQAMKYDETDEDRVANAERHKEEGNKHFKYKKYRWAIDCYTNGIKEKCIDRKLNGILYCNRAAANKHIGNLRSAIKDCATGRRFDPTNLKGIIRGAECLIELGYGRDANEWIETSKRLFAFTKETQENGEVSDSEKTQLDTIEQLSKRIAELISVEERNERKMRVQTKKDVEGKTKLLNALAERNLNLNPRVPFQRPELMDWSLLEVSLPQLKAHQRVCFTDNDALEWPLLIQYPQAGQIDVLTECNETTLIGELLREVLSSPAEWDSDHDFKFESVRFFVSDEYDEYMMEVFEWNDFKTILSLPGYQIRQGLPVIMVFTNDYISDKLKLESESENRYVVA